jgi:hypothetical protein
MSLQAILSKLNDLYVLGAEFTDRLEAAGWRLVSDQQVSKVAERSCLKPNTASLMATLQPVLSSPSTIAARKRPGENELASVLRRQQEDDQRARGSPFDSDESKRDKIKILAF